MRRCEFRFALEILFILLYVLWTVPSASLECAGLDNPFDILPEGDHVIENGSVLQLFCKLNKNHPRAKGLNSSDLHFYEQKGEEKLILPNTTIVNDTTIRVDLVAPPVGSNYYFCILNDTLICPTNVVVGYKPQPVKDFHCVSYNWEWMQCYWTPPENPVKTVYMLNYALKGRSGRFPRFCPHELDIKNNSCKYDHETEPPYRQPQDYYYFTLVGQNALGNLTESHTFHHFAHVIPKQAQNLTIVNKTVGSVLFGWSLPYPMYNFSPGLKCKIEYKNEWEDWVEVKVPQNLRLYGSNQTYNITGLKYHNTKYIIRIHLKSFAAKAGPNEWSPPATINFTSVPTTPYSAPKTTQGGFDIVWNGNDSDVYVYWARVPKQFENGKGFGYISECIRDDGEKCGPPLEQSDSYAKYPISSLHSYKFYISSINELGRSPNTSHVYVPKYGTVKHPERLTKVSYGNGVFELSWKPMVHSMLSNYTIFWCKDDKDVPVPCKGFVDWVVVPNDITSKKIVLTDTNKFFKFAISANFIDGTSSGMTWSSCDIYHNKGIQVDDFHISKIGAREVDVVWEIRCAQRSAFGGFAFYYCPLDSKTQNDNCTENLTEKIIEIDGSQESRVTLTGLKPYTTYALQISVISFDESQQMRIGPKSAAKRFLTLEDAPSAPLHLTASSVTNTSVILAWDLPLETNGILQKYKLHINYEDNQKEVEFNAQQNLSEDPLIDHFKLENLVSFTTYNFTLKACTNLVKCSDYSSPTMVTTLIGKPGKMMRPQVSIVNSTVADVSWLSPVPAAGHLNYYQLLITVNSGSDDNEIFNITGTRAKIAIKACRIKYNTPEFRVRAININENNLTFFGPWSEATDIHCGTSVWAENSVLIDWISGTCSLLIVLVCLICLIKKGWLQCRKMKDVEVKLPAGLQSQDLEKDAQDYVHLERRPPRSPETITGSVGTILAPDEESLLDKKFDESMDNTSFNLPVKNGGDSSGVYSAGRESVSSSITSDTHISSDSGAEPDQSTHKSTPFELWNSSSRRHNENIRNNSPKEPFSFQGPGSWDLNETTTLGYTKVGFKNCFAPEKNLPGKGYVTIGNVTTEETPQKTTNNNNNININNTGNSLPVNNLLEPIESSFSSGPTKNDNKHQQKVSVPSYVSLAQFEGTKIGNSSLPSIPTETGRSSGREVPKLSRLDESSERDDEKTEDSTEEDFSGKETDTETIHEVPLTRNLPAMPPYVSMTDNPNRSLHVNDDDDDDDEDDEEEVDDGEEEEKSKEVTRLSNESLQKKPTSNGIDSSLAFKVNRENESFSNYIPHHLFGKESVQT